MNTLSKLITLAFLLTTQIGFAQIKNATTETVKIYGNCGGCEKTIEAAGNEKKEAMVDWDKDTKLATITYNAKKTNRDEILKRIALAGYDSDEYLAPEASYDKLAKCCQYDRTAMTASMDNKMEMNQEGMDHSKMDHGNEKKTAMNHEGMDHSKMSDESEMAVGDDQLKMVFDHYFELKNALVATDATNAAKHAKMLEAALTKVQMNKLTDKSHQVWMKVMKPLATNIKAISGSKDIKKQRQSFIDLSADMYTLLKASDVSEPVYVQFCPMANGGDGAKWLSKESVVKNPYYGSMMLTCGSVKETIK